MKKRLLHVALVIGVLSSFLVTTTYPEEISVKGIGAFLLQAGIRGFEH